MGHHSSKFNGVVVGSDSVVNTLTKRQSDESRFDGDEFAVRSRMGFMNEKRNAEDLMTRTADSTGNPWKLSNKTGTAFTTRKVNKADYQMPFGLENLKQETKQPHMHRRAYTQIKNLRVKVNDGGSFTAPPLHTPGDSFCKTSSKMPEGSIGKRSDFDNGDATNIHSPNTTRVTES